nr:hypothetical protein [Micromonospora sp. DSM 115978]
SVKARPERLGATSVDPDDLAAMLAHRPVAAADVVSPDHAVRNLLADLMNDEPYSVTHGSFRDVYRARRDAMDAAFDRMEAS